MSESQTAVFNAIDSILSDVGSDIIQQVIERLTSLGVDPTQEDVFLISFSIIKVRDHITSVINQKCIPKALTATYVDMCCGHIITDMVSAGKMEYGDLGIDSVTEGDVSIKLDTDQKKQMIKSMMEGDDLLCYRKLKW